MNGQSARAPAPPDAERRAEILIEVRAVGWRAALADAEDHARRAAEAARALAPPRLRAAGIGIVLADDAFVRELNRDWRGKDRPTNVLSFPALDETPPDPYEADLGDVVIALETTRREAEAEGKPLADHLGHLVVHGVLHLLGHGHETDAEAEDMERLEARLLHGLGIPDPYADDPPAS